MTRIERPSTGKLPLKAVLLVPFLLQLFFAVALVSWLSLRNGRGAVEQVTWQLRSEIAARIEQYVVTHLESAWQISDQTAAAIELGQLDPRQPTALGQHFHHQLALRPEPSFAFWASAAGGAAGAGRIADGTLVVDRTDVDPVRGLVAGTRAEFRADENGLPGTQLKSTPGFDARHRPWFRAAVAARSPIWSEVYTFFAEDSLAIAASQPLYDDAGQLLGVLGVDLTLARVDQFLRSLEIGERGETYIVERSGELIASSVEEAPLVHSTPGDQPRRLMATHSRQPLVATSARFLADRLGGLESVTEPLQLSLEIDGQRHFLDITPLRDRHGIDWLLAIVVPESDFMAPMVELRQTTLLLSLGALLLATLLGLATARWIAQPVQRLKEASGSIADGRLAQEVEVGKVRELSELGQSFNSMARQLQDAFGALEARVAERTAELLEAKETADAANQAKTRFLANISHEIRTPLAAMLGYVDLLSDPQRAEPETAQYLQVIRHNGQHLNRLLSDLLDISRIEAGRLELEIRRTELTRLLAHLQSVFEPRATERGLELGIEARSWLPWTFAADSLRLRQVLSNLLSNAIRYTPEGRVVLRVGSTTPRGEKPLTTSLTFEVIDSGIGIDAADQERLFQPFTQLESTDAEPRRGFGLGLSITRQLLDLMEGSIRLESHPGSGSRFEVQLPVVGCGDWGAPPNKVQENLSNTSLPTLPPLAGRVLIAEDSAPLAKLCQRMLERWGLRCEVAADGQEAVRKAATAPFDVILMDWQMPILDGLEATRELRRQGLETPIIALTAAALEGDREACLAVGCNDYLPKPIDFQELHNSLASLIGSHREVATVAELLADDDELAELERQYVNGLPQRVERLRSAATNRDWQKLYGIAHRLAGTAGTYGLDEVFRAAEQIETAARHQQASAVDVGLERLARAVGAALDPGQETRS